MTGSARALILIQDGLGDRPLAELQGRTPLEAATTPVMDLLAWRGRTGMMGIFGPDGRIGTDVGHLGWFGQDFRDNQYARGPAEAAGVGVELEANEIALRFNFSTLGREGQIVDRRAGRIREGTDQLVASLNGIGAIGSVKLRFFAATEHRGVLVMRGAGLSSGVSDSDPGGGGGAEIQVVRPTEDTPGAVRTALVLNRLSEEARPVLSDHPVNVTRIRQGLPQANGILTRAAGNRLPFKNMRSETGLRIAAVSGESTVIGMARLSGLEAITGPQLTANLDTDLEVKAGLTLDSIRRNDLTFLHLKGCDIAGHAGDAQAKSAFIERTDRMLGPILEEARKTAPALIIGLAADHSTPCAVREHSHDLFPVVLAHDSIEQDDVDAYGERACGRGSLLQIECEEYLKLVFEQLCPQGSAPAVPDVSK